VLAGVSGSSGILNGTGTAARFTSPRSLAINQAGTLIAIGDEHAVRLMTWPGLVVTTLAGVPGTSGYIDAAGAAARFSTVNSLAFLPSGNLLVSDSGNRRIRIINTQSTRVMTFAGSGVSGATNGSGLNATFNTPSVIALSSAGDAAYLIDSGNHIVRRIT
jgi:WD40 repeat protein